MAVLWNAEAILRAIGEPPELARIAGRYMHGLEWALIPNLLYFSARSLFAALDRVAPILISALIALAVNAFANYALVFGHFGAPRLDVLGSGLSTTISQSVMLLALMLFTRFDARLRHARLFALPLAFDRAAFREIWRLGLPIGVTIAFEVAIFAFSALAMGLLDATSIEAHAIVLQITAIAFMVPLGLGQAASVRVGHAYGARDRAGVFRAGWSAFALAMAFVAVSATTMYTFPEALISPLLRADSAERATIAALALSFLRIAMIFQGFDGAQAALANMLRGVHDSRTPAVLAMLGFWGVGAPVGLYLAFETSLRGVGLWIGLAFGLGAVAVLLLGRWLSRQRAGFLP
jgi:MATE family multidrug resistance protein